jgi:hypothetical protein
MIPRVTYRKAIRDRQLLGAVVDHSSYLAWDVLFLAALGEALTADERKIFKEFTRRDHEPGTRIEELIVVKGRRAGGSSAAGKLLIPYVAWLCKHPSLVKGERGVVLCIAPDQQQAAITLDYCAASFEASPILKQMVVGRTADSLTLSNGVSIETRWSNFRRLRGPTYVMICADESAFWFDSDSGSSNSDEEIITACRPGLASTGGPLVMISSPYARRGLLWESYDRHFGAKGDPRILVAQGASRVFNRTLPQPSLIAPSKEIQLLPRRSGWRSSDPTSRASSQLKPYARRPAPACSSDRSSSASDIRLFAIRLPALAAAIR